MRTIYGVLFIALLAAIAFADDAGAPVKPDEKKPDDKVPDDKKPDDKTPDDKKPDDKTPDDKKPDDKKPDDKAPPKVDGPPPPEQCSANGVLLPSATSCSDENTEECAKIFPTAATANPAKRDPNCDNDLMKSVAIDKCAKTCALCCKNSKYNCEDTKGYESVCKAAKDSCKSTAAQKVRDAMIKLCPQTCGLCNAVGAGTCKDNMDDCPAQAILCNDATFGPTWREQCPVTCGSCAQKKTPPQPSPGQPSPAQCKDKLKSCSSNAAKCNNAKFSAFLAANCPQTCGKCGGAGAPGTGTGAGAGGCADSRSCASFLRKGFCTNTWYTMDFRRKTCGHSCGLC